MYVCVCVGVHACTITFAGTEGEGVAPLVRVQADDQGDPGMGGIHPFEKVHSTAEPLQPSRTINMYHLVYPN